MALRSVRMEKSIKGEKNMKKKLMRMPKVVTILVAVLIVAIFLGSMDVAAFFLADTVSLLAVVLKIRVLSLILTL